MDPELDRLYSPQKWIVQCIPESEVVNDFTSKTGQVSNTVRQTVPNTLNVRYGQKPRQLYDLYGTNLPPQSGVVVFLHGGYWQMLDKDGAANLVMPLYNAGYKVIVADYDLSPSVKLKEIVQEAYELYLHILCGQANGIGQCSGVWIMGHSAGAHLASAALNPTFQAKLTAPQKALLRGLILVSGVFDVTPIVKTSINDKLSLTRQDAEEVSTNAFFCDQNYRCKLFITLGGAESPEFHRQALQAHNDANRGGCIRSRHVIIANNDHFTIIERLCNPQFELTQKVICFLNEK